VASRLDLPRPGPVACPATAATEQFGVTWSRTTAPHAGIFLGAGNLRARLLSTLLSELAQPRGVQLLEQPWFYAVRGNHEEMLFAEPGSELAKIHHGAGGEWFFDCDSVEKNHLQVLIDGHCPIAFTIASEFGDIGVSHASAPQNWRLIQGASESDTRLLQDCIWSTKQFQQVKQGQLSQVENIKVTIHGHVNCQQVTTNMNQLWIDTLLRTKRLTVLSAKQVCMVIA